MVEQFSSLESLRAEVDSLDSQILSLVQKRVRIAMDMGELKKKEGRALRDTAREQEVLLRLERENSKTASPLSNQDISLLYKQIMSICLRIQTDQ